MSKFRGLSNFTSIDHFLNNSFLGKGANSLYPGFLKPSRFGVTFDLPSIIFGTDILNIQNYLSDNVISAEIPAFDVPIEDTPLRQSFGSRSTTSMSINFFEDAIMSVRHTMWKWIDFTVKHQSDTDNFERHYLDEVKAAISIVPILLDGNMAPIKHFFDYIFPVAVNPMTFDISDENTVGKTTVTFKYKYHSMGGDGVPPPAYDF